MEATQDNESAVIRELSLPLSQGKMWMKLVGVLAIISGIFTALTIFGIVVAWLPIWMGVLLFQSASAIEQAQMAGDKAAMVESMAKLKTYFTIMGILTLISIAFTALTVVGGIAGGIMGMAEMQGMGTIPQ
mgnify:CR=1 FL=1